MADVTIRVVGENANGAVRFRFADDDDYERYISAATSRRIEVKSLVKAQPKPETGQIWVRPLKSHPSLTKQEVVVLWSDEHTTYVQSGESPGRPFESRWAVPTQNFLDQYEYWKP
jgi:hypothetical protein